MPPPQQLTPRGFGVASSQRADDHFGEKSPARPSRSAHPRARSPYSTVESAPTWARKIASSGVRTRRRRSGKREEENEDSPAVNAAGLVDPGPLSSARILRPRSAFSMKAFPPRPTSAADYSVNQQTKRRADNWKTIDDQRRLSARTSAPASSTRSKVKVTLSKRPVNVKRQAWKQSRDESRQRRAGKVKIIRHKKQVPFTNFKKHDRRRRKDALIPATTMGAS